MRGLRSVAKRACFSGSRDVVLFSHRTVVCVLVMSLTCFFGDLPWIGWQKNSRYLASVASMLIRLFFFQIGETNINIY